jgi:hypothetical protein
VLITNNHVTVNGGGLYFANSETNINNVTLSSNSAVQMAGGIHNYRSTLSITNTVLWDDLPQEIAFITSGGSGDYSIGFSYSNLQGGEEGIENPGDDVVNWLDGNIDENPKFVEEGDSPFQINDGSPCIDAGTPDTSGLNLPDFDLAGEVRIFNDRIDMGAYEWNLFVGIEEAIETGRVAVSIFPNPVNDKLTVSIDSRKESLVKVEMYNISGSILKTFKTGELQNGKQVFSIETGKLKPGIYFLRLQIGNDLLTRKVVKL